MGDLLSLMRVFFEKTNNPVKRLKDGVRFFSTNQGVYYLRIVLKLTRQ
jgi:hypothetical protein